MGRVIKEDEHSDITTVSLEEDSFSEGADRIPSQQVSVPDDGDEETEEDPTRGRVLGRHQTRWDEEPVTITPTIPDTDAPNEASGSDFESDSSDEGEGNEAGVGGMSRRSEEEWQEHLEEAVEEARAEGYEQGYEAGHEEGYQEAEDDLRAEYEEEREALLRDITRFEALWEDFLEESQTPLVELALQLAEAIVDAPLTDSIRKAAEEAVVEAVAELANVPPVTVRVHPVDYQRFHESGLAERLQDKYDDLHLESDPECTEGDWSVSSPQGAIRRLRSEVMGTLRSELSLAPAEVGDETG